MNTRYRGRNDWIAVVVVVVSLVAISGCLDPKKGLGTQGSSDELIVGWGTGRTLNLKPLVDDFANKGVPGGGNPEDVTLVVFYKADGKVFVADLSGSEMLPCAAMVDGTFVPLGDRPLCSNLSHANILSIRESVTIRTQTNPTCTIRSYGGYLIQRCP